jgi:hypothetical protein
MPYGELYIPPVRKPYNPTNGQFLKGHEPANKGKAWNEWMSKRGQRRAKKGWVNIDKYRPTSRPDTAGRCRKEVIAVMDDGTWFHFSYLGPAAEWVGGSRENVGRCCRSNQSKKVCKHDWRQGQPKGASRINTDHRYKGVRFYFETDNIWTTKIKQ